MEGQKEEETATENEQTEQLETEPEPEPEVEPEPEPEPDDSYCCTCSCRQPCSIHYKAPKEGEEEPVAKEPKAPVCMDYISLPDKQIAPELEAMLKNMENDPYSEDEVCV
jgi:hypothetical protein